MMLWFYAALHCAANPLQMLRGWPCMAVYGRVLKFFIINRMCFILLIIKLL